MNSTLNHVRDVWDAQRAKSPIYALLLDTITITDASPGTIHASLRVTDNHTNSKGGLHGTLSACVVDWAAGMAIASHGASYTGVSTDLHVSYLSSATQGEVLEITGRALKVGGTLAFVSVEIEKVKENGDRVMVATGLHTNDPVTTFWDALPDDAGIYRETITVASDRTQYATNKPQNIGMGCLGPCAPLVDKTGYWGCYYHRIPAIASATGPEGRLPSPLKGAPRRREDTRDIRHGRVRLTRFPENLCFVVEGQDHSGLTDVERETWFGKFDASATGWLSELQSAGSETGLLDKRMCYDPRSGRFRDGEPEEFGYNRKVQLFYFLDMECMERMGRMSKVHVRLRKDFLRAYGPGGELAETGGICLWVETSILKAGGLDCEYVGCWDGTGLMGYEWDSA
ncbi:hypothetical protein ANOM_000955 [Aspergillus nomiae NRRL 13137]|uniref:Thioesterase domain-containing protein n=1 Tax=Aspergillus nomiae NRRL (strain ATCC 15546 / NRRL 13137 / CBS 260.88 / M93) TaxID=1509407 RepID=A0A0L1JHG3_ASPN3|nr:uncharacterized protein ANOM_000955 [Aspergillus nomiae NRRL 13137]KNG90828.1 hypothetical protein ANOM_000955 [Aspergillus nomiae NRRL 13137]